MAKISADFVCFIACLNSLNHQGQYLSKNLDVSQGNQGENKTHEENGTDDKRKWQNHVSSITFPE